MRLDPITVGKCARLYRVCRDTIELYFFRIGENGDRHYFLRDVPDLEKLCLSPFSRTAMSDDHSELVPPLPIPNRAVKRLSADDSADLPVRK